MDGQNDGKHITSRRTMFTRSMYVFEYSRYCGLHWWTMVHTEHPKRATRLICSPHQIYILSIEATVHTDYYVNQ